MTFIFNTGPASPIAMGQQLQLASQIEMGNVTSGQSVNHGDNKVTGHSVWDPMQASSGGPSYGQLSSRVAGLRWTKSLKGLAGQELCLLQVNRPAEGYGSSHLTDWPSTVISPIHIDKLN
jgi:hypothetical protein